MTDAIGMIEALSQWGKQLDALEATAKDEGIVPGDYLGDYHAAVMRMVRGIEAVEHARAADTREMFETAHAAAEANAEQARIELRKMEQARQALEADLRSQQLKIEKAQMEVVKRLVEEVGKKVGDASVIRAKAYSRQQFAKTVAAGVAAVMLLLVVGFGVGRASVDPVPAPIEADDGG